MSDQEATDLIAKLCIDWGTNAWIVEDNYDDLHERLTASDWDARRVVMADNILRQLELEAAQRWLDEPK